MARRKVDKHEIVVRMDRIRRAYGLNYAELSRRTKLSSGHLWNIFNGKTVSSLYSTVCRIVHALDMADSTIVEQKQRSAKVYKIRA